MADTGTIFLDEIGDNLPLAIQPKLLRVLQKQEFERLGSGRIRRVNVRLVAAMHRNLAEMVSRNEFRIDPLSPERLPGNDTATSEPS
jgi:formate hydrogenlyase transcriptional activator